MRLSVLERSPRNFWFMAGLALFCRIACGELVATSAPVVLRVEQALPKERVDLKARGFLYRIHQINSSQAGIPGANIAHAEAQLAGLIQSEDGNPWPSIARTGPEPDGRFVVEGTINFSIDRNVEQGLFTSANGLRDVRFPGLDSHGNNIAGDWLIRKHQERTGAVESHFKRIMEREWPTGIDQGSEKARSLIVFFDLRPFCVFSAQALGHVEVDLVFGLLR